MGGGEERPEWADELLAAIGKMPSADAQETAGQMRERAGVILADAMRRQEAEDRIRRYSSVNGNNGWLQNLKVDTGHLITMAGMLVAFGLAFYTYAGDQAIIRRELAESQKRALEYIPRIIALERDNAIQNDRIQNITVALSELRRQNNEIMVKLSSVSEDMASVKAKLTAGK